MKKLHVANLRITLIVLAVFQTITACSDETDSFISINTLVQGLVTQEAKLTASDGAANDRLGYSVSASGNTAIAGAYLDDDKGSDSGSAYIFVRTGTTWSQQQKLTASDGTVSDAFGISVSLSGNTALIGAYQDSDISVFAGSAYIFIRSGTTWSQQQKLTASDGASNDYFGFSVSLSGNTALIGARNDDDVASNSGSAYVFVRSGTTWSQQQKFTASDGAADDNFGLQVSLSDDTALIGSLDDDRGTDAGAAYFFVRSGTTWSQQQKLTASDGAASDLFGSGVSLSGNTALIGAEYGDGIAANSGATYVYTRSGIVWTQQQKLTASDGAWFNSFGFSVSVLNDTALIGDYTDGASGSSFGSAYLFSRSGTTWSQQQKFTASDKAANDYFGFSVSLSAKAAVIGALFDDDMGSNSGSIYAFIRN